ncbi:MAG: FMN-binding negative transcriptional regulator [Cocleimonas sp.]
MHIPSSFKEDNPTKLLEIMQENAFATIITTDPDGLPVATSLPFLIKQKNDQFTLQAHFAKANPQWEHLEKNKQVLVTFNGPHCYISPTWYRAQGVPTWNYVAVHAYGSATLFDNKRTAALIETLSDKYEATMETPWKAQSAGVKNYAENLLDHIIGFEITVHKLQGKVKISQNKTIDDLKSVVKALQQSSSEQEQKIAQLIQTQLKKATNNE